MRGATEDCFESLIYDIWEGGGANKPKNVKDKFYGESEAEQICLKFPFKNLKKKSISVESNHSKNSELGGDGDFLVSTWDAIPSNAQKYLL